MIHFKFCCVISPLENCRFQWYFISLKKKKRDKKKKKKTQGKKTPNPSNRLYRKSVKLSQRSSQLPEMATEGR